MIKRLFKRKKRDQIDISIDGKKYTFKGITLEKWYTMQDLYVEDSIETQVQMISLLFEAPEEEVWKITPAELQMTWSIVLLKVTEWNNAADFKENIVINGKLYKFVDLKAISIGEFAYLDILSLTPKSLHSTLSVLYRPVNYKGKVEKYDPNKCKAREEDFKQVDVRLVFGALNFFLRFTRESYVRTLDYLEKTAKTEKEKREIESLRSIVSHVSESGEMSSSSSQETMHLELERLRDSITQRLLDTFQSLKTEITEENKKS